MEVEAVRVEAARQVVAVAVAVVSAGTGAVAAAAAGRAVVAVVVAGGVRTRFIPIWKPDKRRKLQDR